MADGAATTGAVVGAGLVAVLTTGGLVKVRVGALVSTAIAAVGSGVMVAGSGVTVTGTLMIHGVCVAPRVAGGVSVVFALLHPPNATTTTLSKTSHVKLVILTISP